MRPRARVGLAARFLALAALLLVQLSAWACAQVRVAAPLPALDGSAEIAVVVWNLDAGRGDLNRLIADLTSGRLAGVVPKDYLLLLQEARNDAVTATARSRNLHAFFAPVRDGDAGAQGNAIVSTLTLADTRVIPLPRERQLRVAAYATIELREQRLFVVSVHLENRVSLWRGGGLSSDAARRRQAEALLEAMPGDAPGILGGDLNTWLGPQEPAWRLMAERFPDSPPAPEEPTFEDRLVLDHVFFDLPDGLSAKTAVAPDSYGSNHHPVIGVVTSG